jgi:hypothetical protein
MVDPKAPNGPHAGVSSSLVWWQTLVSGAVGGGITLGGQWFAARHQSQAAREARVDERREVRAARRDAFELTQLEELEAVVLRMSTAIFTYRASSPQSIEIADDTPEGAEFHASRREMQTLAARTLDKDIREKVSALVAQAFPLATEGSGRKTFELAAQVQTARVAIGDRIRTLYVYDGSCS